MEINSFEDVANLRESYDFEAKEALGRDGEGEVPDSLWETYSAMANTSGGMIVLGIKEKTDGTFVGKGIKNTHKVLNNFWNTINNKSKINVCLLSDSDVNVIPFEEDRFLIVIRIPRANRRSKPVFLTKNPYENTFRRNNEGDYRCSKQEIDLMIADAVNDTRDDSLLENFSMDDLDQASISAYRNEFRSSNPGHPWLTNDDKQMLIDLGGWAVKRENKAEGPTLAGVLMFGKWRSIREAVNGYHLDYQDHTGLQDGERWSDRVVPDGRWSGNLYDFYRKVYAKLVADLKLPFRIKGGRQRIDETPVHEAIREALINALVHADYGVSGGISIFKKPDTFVFSNPGGLRLPLDQVLRGGKSDCRNVQLQLMFQLAGAGDKAGSGIPKIMSAWTGQHWKRPYISETVQPEAVTLEMPMVNMFPDATMASLRQKLGHRLESLTDTERLILAIAEHEGEVNNRRLQQSLNRHPSEITDLLLELVERNYLEKNFNSRWTTYYVRDMRIPAIPPPSPSTQKSRRNRSKSPSVAAAPMRTLFDEIQSSDGMSPKRGITPVHIAVPPSATSGEKTGVSEQAGKLSEQLADVSEQARELSEHQQELSTQSTPGNLSRAERRLIVEAKILDFCRTEGRSVKDIADHLSPEFALTADTIYRRYLALMLKGGRVTKIPGAGTIGDLYVTNTQKNSQQ